jgi:hypothetical protein
LTISADHAHEQVVVPFSALDVVEDVALFRKMLPPPSSAASSSSALSSSAPSGRRKRAREEGDAAGARVASGGDDAKRQKKAAKRQKKAAKKAAKKKAKKEKKKSKKAKKAGARGGGGDSSSSSSASDESDTGGDRAAPHRCTAPLWLLHRLTVRVVSKEPRMLGRADGREPLDAAAPSALYLRKGVVTLIEDPGAKTCSLTVDLGEGRSARRRGVSQDALETVLPPGVGGVVLIVRGERRGDRATVLAKDKKAGSVSVQPDGDLAIVQLLLDDVCALGPSLGVP